MEARWRVRRASYGSASTRLISVASLETFSCFTEQPRTVASSWPFSFGPISPNHKPALIIDDLQWCNGQPQPIWYTLYQTTAECIPFYSGYL